jgi:hypothetical protein
MEWGTMDGQGASCEEVQYSHYHPSPEDAGCSYRSKESSKRRQIK